MKRIVFVLALVVLCFGVSSIAFAQACAPPWQVGIAISTGEVLSFNGHNWTAIQPEAQTVDGWQPPNTPALWSDSGPCSGGGGPVPTPTAPPNPTPTTPPGGGGGGGSCFPTWVATQVYTGGMQASLNGINYQAAYWTQGDNPATHNGPAGSGAQWIPLGNCNGGGGGGGGGATPTPTATPNVPPPPPGSKMFAPYMDISLGVGSQVVSMAQQANLRAITLAFMVDGGCTAVWGGLGGSTFPNGTTVQSAVSQLQSNGVAVIISFGGANGSVLSSCGSASQAQAMYQAVVNTYHPAGLDFDIEGGVNTAVLGQALAGLKRANPNLSVSLTLPVLPTGLVSAGLAIIDASVAAGFRADVVNVMAMDYGSANDNGGQMGLSAQQAANSTRAQIVAHGMNTNIGVTPMIGVNDTNTEVFQLSDANSLVNFAHGNGFITRLAMWSLTRDNGNCAGQGFASPVCSAISQSAFQFSQIFDSF